MSCRRLLRGSLHAELRCLILQLAARLNARQTKLSALQSARLRKLFSGKAQLCRSLPRPNLLLA